MVVTAKWYGKALLAALNGEIDISVDTIMVALCTAAYTPDQDANDYYNDISGEVAAGGGYTAGGKQLTTPAVAYDAGTNIIKISGDPVTWASSTITARYAVVYDAQPGSAATDPLICYIDFGGNESSVNGDFTITWDAAGIATVTVS